MKRQSNKQKIQGDIQINTEGKKSLYKKFYFFQKFDFPTSFFKLADLILLSMYKKKT